jgi:choice-of-anchor C domain-containing protein
MTLMFSQRWIGGGVVGAAMLAAAVSQASATTVPDGEFDAPPGTAPFQTVFFGNSLGTWTVGSGSTDTGSGSIDFINGYWQSPPGGGNSVDLDGDSPGSISETVTAPVGSDVLYFYLSGNPDGQPGIKQLSVTIGGLSQTFSYTLDAIGHNSEADMYWVLESLAFTGTGSPITLTFESLDSNSPYGAAVGGISIDPTPLPAALPLFAGGLGLIGLVTRRRKRNGVSMSSSEVGLAV